ncbi:hypothetical protein KAS06_03885, partial [Candidatus Bathyarchaeota archaeon]|nr:hypothetical protein [Candidatus Bathyarchaeota archaeon]
MSVSGRILLISVQFARQNAKCLQKSNKLPPNYYAGLGCVMAKIIILVENGFEDREFMHMLALTKGYT